MQHTIHSVAYLEPVLEGLHMDVGGTSIHRPVHDQVHQADDRGLAGQVLEVLDVLVAARLLLFALRVLDDLAHLALAGAI